MHNFLKTSASASGIVDFLKSFHAQCQRNISKSLHILTEFLIDQRSVCKCIEHTLIMLLCQFHDIFFPHQRLPACHHVKIDTQLFPLRNDAVQIFVRKAHAMTIFRCPASGTVHITGRGRIHQNNPRDAVSMFLLEFTGFGITIKTCLISKVQGMHFRYMRVDLIEHFVCVFHPFCIWIMDQISCSVKYFFLKFIAHQLFRKISQFE